MSELPPPPAPTGRKHEAEKKPDETTAKKKRSPIERAVVWFFILGAGALAAFEYSQRRQYERHLNVIENALEKSEGEKGITYPEIQSQLTDFPEISDSRFGGADFHLYTWKWRGLKEYKIELFVDKESHKLVTLKSDDL